MANVNDVADFLLYLSSKDYDVDGISNSKLQKLMYFSCGVHINKHKEFLFDDTFEVWTFGPVIKEIYKQYNGWGPTKIKGITFNENLKNNFNLSVDEIKSILSAWVNYAYLDEWRLVEICHAHLPWFISWRSEKTEMNKKLMFEYWSDISECS